MSDSSQKVSLLTLLEYQKHTFGVLALPEWCHTFGKGLLGDDSTGSETSILVRMPRLSRKEKHSSTTTHPKRYSEDFKRMMDDIREQHSLDWLIIVGESNLETRPARFPSNEITTFSYEDEGMEVDEQGIGIGVSYKGVMGDNLKRKIRQEIQDLEEDFRVHIDYGSLSSLTDRISDVDLAILETLLNTSLDRLRENETKSYNTVHHVKDKETGKGLIIKILGNEQNARTEAAANYFLSQDSKLAKVITKGFYPEPIKYGDLYITVQEECQDKTRYDAFHYVSALALFHTRGTSLLESTAGLEIPNYKAMSFDMILDGINRKDSIKKYLPLRGRYETIAMELESAEQQSLIHQDLKTDNTGFGKILDLEHLATGNPALDLSLYLVSSGIPTTEWIKYVQAYLDVCSMETKIPYSPKELVDLTGTAQRVAIVPTLRELSGIYFKPMGKREFLKAEMIKKYLISLEQ